MIQKIWHRSTAMPPLLILLMLAGLCGIALAEPDYSITYTITIGDDGSALWRVEYRTLLSNDEAASEFNAYVNDLPALYLPRFQSLMETSASQAAASTGRHMAISGVTGTGTIQTSPTGKFGVVIYTLRWDGFARPGPTMTVGDAFAGGLYLAKDNTLIVQYPNGYTVRSAAPAPDTEKGGLTWYGLRSFGAGEPRIVLEETAFPLVPVAAGLVLAVLLAFVGFFFWHRKKHAGGDDAPDPARPPLSETEILNLEERIRQLLASHGNEMFQSEIVKNLGMPKSTVSSALNDLHARGVIVKVKKGRENLIRLA